MANFVKNSSGMALTLELVLLGALLAVIGSASLRFAGQQNITSPSGKILNQAVLDLAPDQPSTKAFYTKDCIDPAQCPSRASFNYVDVSKLPLFQTRLVGHGWKENPTLADIPASHNTVKDYIKIINGKLTCLNIDKQDYLDVPSILISAYFDTCVDHKEELNNIFSGWSILYPDAIPSRYTTKTYSYELYPGQVELRFSREPLGSTSSETGGWLEINESKLKGNFNPPSNCPIFSYDTRTAYPCALYATTPKGHKVYISNDYNQGTVYLSVAVDKTVLTIRRWYENMPESALTKKELVDLVDSFKAVTLDEVKSLAHKSN